MAKALDLLEAAQAFIAELERELAGWHAEFEPDYPGKLPPPILDAEREARISQMKIIMNSCEAADLRRAIAKAKKARAAIAKAP